MPHASVHLAQATSNEALATRLLGPHLDWSVTAAFYAALHYVEVWRFTTPSPHSFDHADRANYLRVNLVTAFISYRYLEERSKIARYLDATSRVAGTSSPASASVLNAMAGTANTCLNVHLPNVKRLTKAELCEYLVRIGVARPTFDDLYARFDVPRDIFSAGRAKLLSLLAIQIFSDLETCIIRDGGRLPP